MPEATTVEPREASQLRYEEIREYTELLAAPLSAEDQTVQSMPDVSPTKWHRGHTSWFFETFLLQPYLAGFDPYHPAYCYLFNSYYEAVGTRHPRPQRGLVSRPGIAEVAVYRKYVDVAMAELLAKVEEAEVLKLVELGIHHEQQHQELLLMDVKHVLSCNPLLPAYAGSSTQPSGDDHSGPTPFQALPPISWAAHERGTAWIGHGGEGFAFDNEMPSHPVILEPFAMASRLVTCGEWAAFIDDGGYQRPELWLSDGWGLCQAERWSAPLYWSASNGTWQVFTLMGPRPVDPYEPVCHVSYYEADAFARWAGARLPTEAEWEVMATSETRRSGPPTEGVEPTAQATEGPVLHPRPSDGRGSLFDDVWQWTSSAYSAYPGFHPARGAVGEYNGKFMVNQYVLRGGCCVTPPNHLRATYRNFFPPSARWPFAGLRLARDR